MLKPKLIFIGRKYHSKTKSDELIISVLSQYYEVILLRREELLDKEIVQQVNTICPQAVLFWCLPPSYSFHLRKFKCQNIIWAPMWDGFKPLSWKKKILFRLYKVKIICFSQVLYQYFQKTALKCQYWQCFLEPKIHPQEKREGPYTFFLWQRDPSIGIDQLIQMVGEKEIGKVIYKTEIEENLHKEYPFKIEKITDWLPKEDYQKILKGVDFFIAPRKAEGIGFSFLEPMSQGIPVIAYNNATMNEYVIDGENGFLFDDQFQLSKPLKSPQSLSASIEKCAQKFYQNWQNQKNTIISLIQK